MSAACGEILASSFPLLDEHISEYLNGVVSGGAEDFSNSDELYDAIGDVLLDVDKEKDENDIRDFCDRLFKLMFEDNSQAQNTDIKTLVAPVQLGSLAAEQNESLSDAQSIWMAKKETTTVVDARRLEKAEQKIKEKQEKRATKELAKTTDLQTETASVSQQTNRKEAKQELSGTNKSYDVNIENFDVAFGNKVLLSCATLHMAFGRRYGLVGRNGIGKTTLLRMLASGELKIPSHISILHVEQEVVGDDTLAVDSVLECDTKRSNLLKEEKEIVQRLSATGELVSGKLRTDSRESSRLAEIYHQLELIDADKAPAKAATILAGLGFTTSMQKQTTKEFSGGWRMRLALARALFSKPDLLLLDEPTNMLDLRAIVWLESYLQEWPTTILLVSHDRSFLNGVTTDILHLHSKKLDYYKGDFETFFKTREEKLKNQQREFEAQKQYRDHIQVFIDRFRYNANRASQVQSKLKLLEKLPQLEAVEKESEVVLRFPDSEVLAPPVLQIDEMGFYYKKEQIIFKNVSLNAASESRICIVGENGAGKTTLLKILLGDLEPTSGFRHSNRSIRIGYFSQHHVDALDLTKTSVEILQAKYPGRSVEEYRNQLGRFGVTGELALRQVHSLSGGQKSRVAFSVMSMGNPNFFILDEPTNHLDMETIEALGTALNAFRGGVMLVSHDERLIRLVCSELWLCKDGGVHVLEGGIDQYRTLINKELSAQ